MAHPFLAFFKKAETILPSAFSESVDYISFAKTSLYKPKKMCT